MKKETIKKETTKKKPEVKVKTPEDAVKELLEQMKGKKEESKEKVGIDFMKILNDPMAKELLGGCKDLFKKEKADPNVCEIAIKAPSEVVLKLFGLKE